MQQSTDGSILSIAIMIFGFKIGNQQKCLACSAGLLRLPEIAHMIFWSIENTYVAMVALMVTCKNIESKQL